MWRNISVLFTFDLETLEISWFCLFTFFFQKITSCIEEKRKRNKNLCETNRPSTYSTDRNTFKRHIQKCCPNLQGHHPVSALDFCIKNLVLLDPAEYFCIKNLVSGTCLPTPSPALRTINLVKIRRIWVKIRRISGTFL